MVCSFEIEVEEPDGNTILFRPYVTFRIHQLNMTPQCRSDKNIDDQINLLIEKVEDPRKKTKKKLKNAISKHDQLIEV